MLQEVVGKQQQQRGHEDLTDGMMDVGKRVTEEGIHELWDKILMVMLTLSWRYFSSLHVDKLHSIILF